MDPALLAAQQEAERRERILADRRRVAAKWRPKIPEVRKVNFENFKNRFHDVDQPGYAIEVLMAGPTLQNQIRREQATRRKESLARFRQSYLMPHGVGNPTARAFQAKSDMDDRAKDKRSELQANETEIHRIRIQSQAILGHLTPLLGETEEFSSPRTFARPFKPLVYFQPKMKAILATLEEKWADYEDLDELDATRPEVASSDSELVTALDSNEGSAAAADDDDNQSLKSIDSNAEDLEAVIDSTQALRDMRCYVDFVDKEVMPLYERYNGTEEDKVRFDDLWSLFRNGDLLYMPSTGETSDRYHEVWRIYDTNVPEPDTSYHTISWQYLDGLKDEKKAGFDVFAYYVDHDGSSYGAVRQKFTIEHFQGERPIESLEVFPIRFRHDHQQILDQLLTRGRNFQSFLTEGHRHQSYNAWTLTRNPPCINYTEQDEILKDAKGEKMRHPEFVESDVIVDLAEAYQKNPEWRPTFFRPPVSESADAYAEDDEMKIQQWFHGSRQELAYEQVDNVQKADGVEVWQRRENLKRDEFLRQRTDGIRKRDKVAASAELRPEDLVLLPKRMFAYALRERRFIPVNINFLKPIRRQQGVFESLKILRDYKDIVRGLVGSHFQKKSLERRYVDMSTEGPSQDLIQGKGRGLVVLLHGVPGVGKTATAEAVAMENRKPLFVITCGDLGLTPSEVEASLSNVFRLAHLWDCVLLLDEADVFLSQRSKLDMKRNALVSVFLRVLEYYNGLLFLTTNRVGTIDEAFKSRIHMSLYYPPLDKTQTRDIFRLNIAKLREIEAQRRAMTGEPSLVINDGDIIDFAGRHYEENARLTGCWNGRQIRNAFQIAASLAQNSYADQVELARSRGQQPPAAPVLDRSLFEKVQMSTQSFDRHMKESKGFDADLPLRNTFHKEAGHFE